MGIDAAASTGQPTTTDWKVGVTYDLSGFGLLGAALRRRTKRDLTGDINKARADPDTQQALATARCVVSVSTSF